jgi:2-dehydro-3-deoxyphosphogluconate aldolase/(4S)-4-hydroxy-2-oxoglutarate aldolase
VRSVDLKMTEIFAGAGVVPVVKVDDTRTAVLVAEALVAGGLNVIEIVLRTPRALDAVTAIRNAVPECVVGVGTVLNIDDFARSEDSGSAFAVSPGFSPALLQHAKASKLAYLPAASTPAEVLQVQEAGFETMKFFPAERPGGIEMLTALEGPFPRVKFCCTGGIKMERLTTYKALNNVVAIGASFMLPVGSIAREDWKDITSLAIKAKRIWNLGTETAHRIRTVRNRQPITPRTRGTFRPLRRA